MEFKDRLKMVRSTLSQKVFADKIGVHFNTVSRWERGEQVPNQDDIRNILLKFPNINPSWFVLGEGRMERGIGPIPGTNNDEFDLIPMVETKLSAGGGAFVFSENVEGYYAFRKKWVRRVAISSKDLVLMRVDGGSMSPTILDGDTVMIDAARRDIKEGHLYAIRLDSTVMVKRLAFRPGGKIVVISDNRAEYDSYEVDQAELHVLGMVIFFSRVLVRE